MTETASAKAPLKGSITLTLPRSGSSWVATIAKKSGNMGLQSEWLDFQGLPKPLSSYNADRYYRHVIASASTPNGRFSLKIFPQHLQDSFGKFGFDFIRRCRAEHDVTINVLKRKDRLGQAISLVLAMQTQRWNTDPDTNRHRRPRYSFAKICQASFQIGQGYAFWENYLAIHDITYETFVYETLLDNPAPYFDAMAQHMGVPALDRYETHLKIQRNELNAAWRQRFHEDIAQKGMDPAAFHLPQPEATLSNAARVLFDKPLWPKPRTL